MILPDRVNRGKLKRYYSQAPGIKEEDAPPGNLGDDQCLQGNPGVQERHAKNTPSRFLGARNMSHLMLQKDPGGQEFSVNSKGKMDFKGSGVQEKEIENNPSGNLGAKNMCLRNLGTRNVCSRTLEGHQRLQKDPGTQEYSRNLEGCRLQKKPGIHKNDTKNTSSDNLRGDLDLLENPRAVDGDLKVNEIDNNHEEMDEFNKQGSLSKLVAKLAAIAYCLFVPHCSSGIHLPSVIDHQQPVGFATFDEWHSGIVIIMDNFKHKDGMLAAGKKRLEQFRLKKQGKGSSSKENKQETDIEQGRPRSEVNYASHKGSKSKINAYDSDLEGIEAKGSRTHSLIDEQGAVNASFGDDSKELLHVLTADKSVDKDSPINIEHNSVMDVDIGSAHASYTEGNTLEQWTVAGEEMPVVETRELGLTFDSSQLQPSIAGQLENPAEQDRLDFVGAPDLATNAVGSDLEDIKAKGSSSRTRTTLDEQGATYARSGDDSKELLHDLISEKSADKAYPINIEHNSAIDVDNCSAYTEGDTLEQSAAAGEKMPVAGMRELGSTLDSSQLQRSITGQLEKPAEQDRLDFVGAPDLAMNAVGSDSEGMKAMGRTHTSLDEQGAANVRSGDDSKELLHDLIAGKLVDKAYPINIECNSAIDVDNCFAHASYTEGDSLEQCAVAGEEMPVVGMRELGLTLDSSQLQPSITGQLEKPAEQDHLDFVGAPDLAMSAVGSDLEGMIAKGSRTHTDEQGAANARFGDNCKELLHDLIADKSVDKADLINIEHNSDIDVDNGSAHASYTEGDTLEQCTVAGEEIPVVGMRELGLTLDSSQLQPSSTGQLEKPAEQDRLDFVGAPDLAIIMADFTATDFSRNHHPTKAEHGIRKAKNENISLKSVDAFQECDNEQSSGPESSAPSILSGSSNDSQDVIVVEMKKHGDEMALNNTVEVVPPSLSYPFPNDSSDTGMVPSSPITTPDGTIMEMISKNDANDNAKSVPFNVTSSSLQVLTSSQSTSDRDEGDASRQLGRDFDTRNVEITPGSSIDTDVLQIVSQIASKEKEPCSSESSRGTHSFNVSKPEPIVDLDTDVVPALCSEDDSRVPSQTPNIENVTNSESEVILVGSISKESASFDQPQTADLDVSMVRVISESILDHEGFGSTTDHGYEGSEGATTTPIGVNTTELHCIGVSNESVPNEVCGFTGSQTFGESAVSLLGISLTQDLDHEEFSSTINDGCKKLENIFANPILEISNNSHCDDIVLDLVKSSNLENPESDTGVIGAPPESSLDHEGLSLTNDHASAGTSWDRMPVVQRQGMSDLKGTESSEPEGYQDGMPVVQREGMQELELTDFSGQEGLKVDKFLPAVQREELPDLTRTESLEQGSLMAGKVLDGSPETEMSTATYHHDSVISSRDNLVPNGADWRSWSGMPLDPGQGAWGSGYVESSIGSIQESSFEGNLRFFRSLEGVGADQAILKDQIKAESIDIGVANAYVKDHSLLMKSSREIAESEAFGQTSLDSWNLRERLLLGSDNDCGIDQGEKDRPPPTDSLQILSVLITAEDGKVVDGCKEEMRALPSTEGVLSNSLEKEESTEPTLKPSLESRTGSMKDKEVAMEVLLESNNDNAGIAPFTFAVDSSCSNAILEDTSDACGYLKHEVAAFGLDAERDLPTIQQRKEDAIGEAGRTRLESDSLSPPYGNEVMSIQRADVCSCQPDLESHYTEPFELSSSLEHVLSVHKTSELGDHMELQDSFETYKAVPLLVNPGACVDQVPLLIKAKEDFEEGADPSVPRFSMEDCDINVNSRRIDTLPLDAQQAGQDIEVFDNSLPPVICDTSGSSLEGKKGIESKAVMRELQVSLCMKQAELENIVTLMNAQAAKNLEERGMFVKFFMHVMKTLSYFVPQESILNEYTDLQFELFNADIAGSTKFEHFFQDYDCWMESMQKDLEEKRELEATKRHLEDTQVIKDSEMKELLKQIEDLSQKCKELQKDSDEKQQLKSRTSMLEDLLSAKNSDIEKLSEVVSEVSCKCDLTMNELAKAVEERLDMEGNVKQLEALLLVKDTDIGRLSDEVSELSKKCDWTMSELAKAMEKRANLDEEHKQLEDLLSAKEIDLGRMLDSMSELSQKADLTLAEMGQVLEEKVSLEGELKYVQNLHAEQENKTHHLEDLLLVKDHELKLLEDLCTEHESKILLLEESLSKKDIEYESLQKLYADEREGHSSMLTQASALAERVTALLDPPSEVVDGGDAIGTLGILVASLHHQYETVFKENKDLALRAVDSDTAYEVELRTLRGLLSEKEADLGRAEGKVDLLTIELSKTKEDGERKLQEAEQKVLGIRERLSLAVTKGKGLVQQRDNLKQLLTEKTAELEALALLYQQELHAKTVALNNAESKVKLNSEAGERVEALESELSYIRNSANALRESFLQKDAVLQKIEELLEDSCLPEELQIKDTYEKVEWLIEPRNPKVSTSVEGPSETLEIRTLNTSNYAGQASQTEEFEQLNRKCDDYVRKYRAMAEELAMLEQSLLERNMLIQRWEEMLDNVDMPASIRSKEPEDKIQWLGKAVSDSCNSIAHLQADMETLQTTAGTLNHSVQTLQEQNSVLSAELIAKEDELRAVALDLEDMTMKFNSLVKPASESKDEACRPAADTRELEASENNQEESQQLQIENLGAVVPKIRMLLTEVLQEDEVDKMFADVSASAAFETSVTVLVENSKIWLAEARETKGKLSELTLAIRKVEEGGEEQIHSLHEAIASKTLQLNNLNMQLEGFAVRITSLEDEVDHLQKELKAKTEELSYVRDELNKSHLEASQAEEKLASVREKLSMAVKKGKGVVQQRDTLKQSLDEKVAELDRLRRDCEAESVAFTKAKHGFKHQVQELEAELTSSRKYGTTLEKLLQENNKTVQKFAEALDKLATAGAPRSGDLMEKVQWTSQLVFDLQRKAGISEQEAKKSKKATELLALELEEVQGRMDSLTDELMHAENNASLLIEEKKLAEASKAEAGLRLEHAMANINSLLFELSESKDAQANLEQENSSLKDSLAAQMEEIRFNHTKAEEQLRDLTDLYNKVRALKASGSTFLGRVAEEVFKLLEDVKGTRSLIVRISRELKEQGSVTLPAVSAFGDNFPLKWEPEFLNKRKATQEWKQGVTTGSIRLLCEEMEIELQNFEIFINDFMPALNKASAKNCQLLSELHNDLGSFTKTIETFKRNADIMSSTESLMLQKDEQMKALEELFKTIAQKVRLCVEEVEGLISFSPCDSGLPISSHESIVTLVERLSSSVKGLAQSCQDVRIESDKQNEELRFQLKEAKHVIDAMGQQQQIEKLKLQKCQEEFEGKDDILKRTYEELCSLHDVLGKKNQEEQDIAEALEKAETKITQLSAKVEELENAKRELEASLGKASSRFFTTVSKLDKFQSLSEKLIEEAESLHLLLEDRDAQISLMKDEVAHKASEVTDLQNLVDERTADLSQVYQQLRVIVSREASNGELLPDPGRRQEILEALAMSVRAGSESLRVQLARKDALLQDVQLRHDDLARKVHALESSVQESQRLTEERGTAEHMMITVEPDEKGNRGKNTTPSVALVSHGRGGRKAAVDHSSLDVDTESARLLTDVDDDDKGHVFKPLTSSRLVPRGTRILVDRLDSFWYISHGDCFDMGGVWVRAVAKVFLIAILDMDMVGVDTGALELRQNQGATSPGHREQCRGSWESKTEKNQRKTSNYRGWLCSVLTSFRWILDKDSGQLRIPYLQTDLGRVLRRYAAQIHPNRWILDKDSGQLRIPYLQTDLGRVLRRYVAQIHPNRRTSQSIARRKECGCRWFEPHTVTNSAITDVQIEFPTCSKNDYLTGFLESNY
ncbi:hypothetical protein L7F22_013551 [Adiantum nelumboides]|nr:hypothetical protein [Adiantum nelumboides]